MNNAAQRLADKSYSAESIYHDIRKKILKLSLEPGSLISENQTAADYGVSRSVIRVVFARLNQDGFIDIYPQRGTYVSLIDPGYVRNLLTLRAALEKEAIHKITRERPEEERLKLVAALAANLEEQKKYRDEVNYMGKFPGLDTKFHLMIYECAQMVPVLDIIKDKLLHVLRWQNFDMQFVNKTSTLFEEHVKIYEAIKEGNTRKASDTIDSHLEHKVEIAEQAIKEYPQYFANR